VADLDTDRSGRAVGVAATAAPFFVWGILPAYWKLLGDVPPLQLTAHRTIWTLVVAVVLLSAGRQWRGLFKAMTSPATASRLLLAAVLLGTNWFIFILSVNTDRVLEASLGYYINPLVSVLLGRLILGERMRPIQMAAVGLALAAVVNLIFNYGRFPWIALSLAGSFAFYGLIRKTTDIKPLAGLMFEMSVLAVPALILLAVLHTRGVSPMAAGAWSTRALLVGTGLVTAVPLLLFAHGVRRIRLSAVGFLQYIAPSCMFLQAVLMYGESFTRPYAITFALIWAALALFSWDSIRNRHSRDAPVGERR